MPAGGSGMLGDYQCTCAQDLAWWPVGAGILDVEGTGEKKILGSSSISQALGSLQPATMESNFKGQPDQLAQHKVYV